MPGTSGCYGAGFLGPFGKVGAMLEGLPTQNLTKGTVTRYIYVLDESYASGINGVALFVYKKVDTIAGGSDAITVTLFKTVILPPRGAVRQFRPWLPVPNFCIWEQIRTASLFN